MSIIAVVAGLFAVLEKPVPAERVRLFFLITRGPVPRGRCRSGTRAAAVIVRNRVIRVVHRRNMRARIIMLFMGGAGALTRHVARPIKPAVLLLLEGLDVSAIINSLV